MTSGRSREPHPQRAEPTPFAARAKDLGALRDALVDAAGVGVGLWLSYLFVLFYFAIAAGAVTHRDLFLENRVKLPFLNVELPLKAFFILGPLVFLIVHTYVLLHFVLLAGKIGAFHVELQAQIAGDEARARLRRQLPSNIFVQSLAGPREVRTGAVGFLLRQVAQISLVAGPIALLVLFQLQFLPHHSPSITWWQRIALVLDLLLLWLLWPPIARGETSLLAWRDFTRVKVLAWIVASTLPVLLVCTIATFPGEWLEDHIPSIPIVPTEWPRWSAENVEAEQLTPQNQSPTTISKVQSPRAQDQPLLVELKTGIAAVLASMKFTSMHKLLVAGDPDFVAQRPSSLWSNVLVLPNFEVGDRVKFDADGKIAISSETISLRGRSLEGIVLSNARLKKADFTGAQLQRANFSGADLREAKFGCDLTGLESQCAQLQGALLNFAQLQGASLESARLQDASFTGARLQGSQLGDARLQGAAFVDAQLQGALLDHAQLQAAHLGSALLMGALLDGAQLQGAELGLAGLQGASLEFAQMEGASLDFAQLQGASLDGAQLQGASLNDAQLQGASLTMVFVWRAEPSPGENATGAFVAIPETEPKYRRLNCEVLKSCEWTGASFAILKALIEDEVSAGRLRTEALARITKLEKPPYTQDEGSAKAWAELAKTSRGLPDAYAEVLAKKLKDIGCAADGAPYVIAGLISQLDHRFGTDTDPQRYPAQEAAVAAAFLHEENCPGARGLSDDNKAKLQHMRDRPPAPPSPAAAAR
jgi:uncharacterized protein YjbI with pentapeptide repeats